MLYAFPFLIPLCSTRTSQFACSFDTVIQGSGSGDAGVVFV